MSTSDAATGPGIQEVDMRKLHKLLTVTLVVLIGFGGTIAVAKKSNVKNENKKRDQQAIAEGNTAFALDLYAKLKDQKKDENLFFSPYSISTALAMTWAGARGETEKQMAQTLHFTLDQERTHPAFAVLQKYLNAGGKKGGYQLNVANALWGQKEYDFLREFLERTDKYYSARLNEVDFVNETEKTRQRINAWVEKKTNNKIKNLIKKGVLKKLTRLVLTNAIYFKGDWAVKFREENTKTAPFHITAKKKVEAPLMYQMKYFKYAETENLQILELPYKGDDLSMVVLLPHGIDGLGGLEKVLNSKTLKGYTNRLRQREVRVFLPKFKMTCEFSLAGTLAAMGMPNAFTMAADFSGMNGRKDLYISAVVHKAFVEVHEEGTEAAAATGVVMTTKAMPTPPPVFRADHPFLFLIRDNHSGSILFLGRMMNPAKK